MKLAKSSRVPSYKSIALAILRNDWNSLGVVSHVNESLVKSLAPPSRQGDLF